MLPAIKPKIVGVCAILCMFALSGGAEEQKDTGRGVTNPKMRIAVLDFTCIDLVGQKLNLTRPRPVNAVGKGTLNDADRLSIDARMQGFVRMVDARFSGAAAMAEIHQTLRENERDRRLREALATKILNSARRPIIIGAEYMTAALGEYPETFSPTSREGIESALQSFDAGRRPDAEDVERSIREFAARSGATHILTGTVADLKTEHRKFSGYGLNTDRVNYSLDVLIKVIDLKNNRIVFTALTTGEQSRMNTEFAQTVNDSLFQDLLKDAVKQAAAAMNARFATDDK